MGAKRETARRPLVRRILLVLAVAAAVLVAGTVWYFGDYYHASATAVAAAADEDGSADGVTVRTLSGGATAFIPAHPAAGLVFYPGAKVEATAYASLATQLARQNVLCVLVQPPLNFAFLDIDAADPVMTELSEEVDTWLVGGHSLGGVAACAYAAQHEDDLAGIVLLASYPATDLSTFDGTVLSIAGSNDEVLNREAYAQAQEKLPATAQELVIAGGNHANYADYGAQDGDGEPTITREEQQAQTVTAIVELVQGL